tara:strand:- start:411 stop:680 length:270 start_codon:yes stop_codon:yes gene_type:complete
MTSRTIAKLEIYWDSQDSNNEGWAERITYNDDHQESGELSWPLADDAKGSALADAVVNLAFLNDLVIASDDVGVEAADGGHAWHERITD